jgi:MoxR-like ATPase
MVWLAAPVRLDEGAMSDCLSLEQAGLLLDRLRQRMRHAVVGREDVIELIIMALIADGHVLLEDYPGSGKTTLAKALGYSITDDLPDDGIRDFARVQFTPDLLPSDITGANVFNPDTKSVTFQRGPIFAYVVLGDEINRTSPRVQAATLEAMAEKQITVDGTSYKLDELFFFMCTQNPLDMAGTYPLPAAQMDRFLFKISMDYIERDAEIAVLRTEHDRALPSQVPKVSRAEVLQCRRAANQRVFIHDSINETLVDIARASRAHPEVVQGASTRSLMLMRPALRSAALIKQRDFVTVDDVRWLLPHVLPHRLIMETGARPAREVIEECARSPIEKLERSTLSR